MRWSFFLFMLLKVKALLFIYCDRMENVPDDLASDNVAEVDVSGKYIDAVDLERRMWKDRVRLKRIKERTNKTGSQAKRPRRSLTNKTVVNSDNDVDGTEEASGSLTATSQPVRDQDKAEKHRRRKRPRSRSEAEQRNVIPDMNHVDASART